MEFYPEGCRKSLAKTFESVEEIKNAMMKNEIIEGKVLLCDREVMIPRIKADKSIKVVKSDEK